MGPGHLETPEPGTGPFGDLAWDHAGHQLPRATEAEIADAVAALLTRAHSGPKTEQGPGSGKLDRRVVAARTKAAGPVVPMSVAGPQNQPGQRYRPCPSACRRAKYLKPE